MLDLKQNFFTSAAPAPSMPEIMWANDPLYRREYGSWLYENYETLIAEYKRYGRFLSLSEVENLENPLD